VGILFVGILRVIIKGIVSISQDQESREAAMRIGKFAESDAGITPLGVVTYVRPTHVLRLNKRGAWG
jgi:hypothetical protein